MPEIFTSLVTRRSTLCIGRPSSASRGMTMPDVIVVGPSKRSATAAGMTIAGAAAPDVSRFRRLLPGLPYGVAEIVAL